MQLSGRVALVTGGSRGIGRGIAIALAQAGARVALTYRSNRDLAAETAAVIQAQSGTAIALPMTVEDRQSVRRAIHEVKSQLGPIDILVNNAAIAQEKPFETITDADWSMMMQVNLQGPFICCQEVLPDMVSRAWGRIINITSIGGQWGGLNQVHYAAAKAGLINLTRSLARIYSRHGITANAVAPGLVLTDMSRRELESEAGRQKVQNIPIGRVASVEEVAHTVVFLASEAASYITGQTINVNGGMYFG